MKDFLLNHFNREMVNKLLQMKIIMTVVLRQITLKGQENIIGNQENTIPGFFQKVKDKVKRFLLLQGFFSIKAIIKTIDQVEREKFIT